ncbi:hypothetical protein BD560DRAFT_422332 [Blakeslea trispora]|nr:hypothetical protein BD560DRAFT_422332 [Blakeslea trispora]
MDPEYQLGMTVVSLKDKSSSLWLLGILIAPHTSLKVIYWLYIERNYYVELLAYQKLELDYSSWQLLAYCNRLSALCRYRILPQQITKERKSWFDSIEETRLTAIGNTYDITKYLKNC